jgi:two-component system, cell cycle sensor histidine kinase and response regulator CckA
VEILADPGQLEQVLVNLAVNARHAMPSGGTLTIDTGNVTVDADTIAGGSRARKGRNMRLRISDTGNGMPADVAQHVFEPFFTTKPDGGGTGLGLALVEKPFSEADLLAMAGQVLNGHFQGFTTIQGTPT